MSTSPPDHNDAPESGAPPGGTPATAATAARNTVLATGTQLRKGAIRSGGEVRHMFDRIVPRYDLMNHLMTGGRDVVWRKMVAKQVLAAAGKQGRVLDAATGTGDLAFAIAEIGVQDVTGIDFSGEMIASASRKAADRPSPPAFQVGDAMDLPFGDGTFDACTVAFGLRNMPDYDAAIREMTRILKPGGTFICLEMTPFQRPILGPLFRVYFERVVPLAGGLLSGNLSAYRYLPRSVEAFPPAHELAERMQANGLDDVEYSLLAFGTVAIHTGKRALPGGTVPGPNRTASP